jgi:stress response protein YsnF
VMAEEVVAEKRLVPKEQIIIRKRAVTQQQAVEADIRKERVEVDDSTRKGARSTRSEDQTPRL